MVAARVGPTVTVLSMVLGAAACSSGVAPSVLVRVDGRVVSVEDGVPIVGAEVVLANGGDPCIPLLGELSPVARAASTDRLTLATLAPFRTRKAAVRRLVCGRVGASDTGESGHFEIAYQTTSGEDGCTGLVLSVLPDDFIGRYTSLGEIECTRNLQTFDFALTPGTVPFSLIQPLGGAAFAQNDPTSGCAPSATGGAGFRILFDWSDASIPGIDRYRIQFMDPGLMNVVDEVVSTSEYSYMGCYSIPDTQLDPWQWRVRYESGGQFSQWSTSQFVSFEPCRIDEGVPCS